VIDIIIINALKKGNQSAYKILYERTIAYVYSIVRRFVDVEHVHKDIIQDVYAKIYININQFDSDKGTFKFWMRRIVINQCFEYFRREKRNAPIVSIDYIGDMAQPEPVDFADVDKDLLLRAIENMPKGYKNVFLLVEVEGYDHSEVSQITGVSEVSSRSQLSRAKSWLRKELNLRTKASKANGFK